LENKVEHIKEALIEHKREKKKKTASVCLKAKIWNVKSQSSNMQTFRLKEIRLQTTALCLINKNKYFTQTPLWSGFCGCNNKTTFYIIMALF